MADFKTHSVLGTMAGSAFGFLCGVAGALSPVRSVLAAVLFSVASVLPDLDSSTGTAKKFLFETLAVLAPALIVLHLNFETAEQGVLLLLLLFFLVRYPLEFLFERCTEHRGIFHSIPMALVLSAGTLAMFYASPPTVRCLYAAAAGGGYLFHLIVDEIWSFGLFGLGAKKSFGTALKLYSDSFFITLLTYLAALLLFYLALCLTASPDWEYNFLPHLPDLSFLRFRA